MAGAPKGNNNAFKGRKALQALERAIEFRDGLKDMPAGKEYSVLVDMWCKQIDKALEGDNGSMTMIVERLDGKPKQAIVGGDEDDNPILTEVRRVIVRARDTNA